MSLRAMLWALHEAPVDDAQTVLVLLGLADNADEDGRASWPSVSTLAVRARCSSRTVQRHLSALKSAGVIREGDQTLVASFRQDRRPVVYDLNLTAVRGDNVSPRDPDNTGGSRGDSHADRGDNGAVRGDSHDARGVSRDVHGVTPVTERGDSGVTQTVLEPSLEPTTRTGGKPPDLPRPDVEKVCAALADAVERNGSRRPTVTAKWRTEARLMLDRDGRPLPEVLAIIEWATAHQFWRSNVMAVPTLREKYDRLRLQRESGGGRAVGDGRASADPSEYLETGPFGAPQVVR